MERAVLYLRLSREDRGKEIDRESESIENQRLLLTEYAQRHGFLVVGEYTDEDYSGLSDNRPGFRRMLRDAGKGMFDIILAKNQSRFSRNLQHIERYLHRELPMLGIRFIGAVDGVDTGSRANKKARQICALVNEWYSEDLSESVRAVLHRKVQDGQFIGSAAPYGYRKDEAERHRLRVEESEAAVVRKIFESYAAGASIRGICRMLNSQKVAPPQKSRNGHGWNPVTVRRMLSNEVYLGHLLQGKSTTRSYKDPARIYFQKENWVRRTDTHPPVISKELFEKVQRRLDRQE